MEVEEESPPELESNLLLEEWLLLRWVVTKDFSEGAPEEMVCEDMFVERCVVIMSGDGDLELRYSSRL